jgi:hypothetical protein
VSLLEKCSIWIWYVGPSRWYFFDGKIQRISRGINTFVAGEEEEEGLHPTTDLLAFVFPCSISADSCLPKCIEFLILKTVLFVCFRFVVFATTLEISIIDTFHTLPQPTPMPYPHTHLFFAKPNLPTGSISPGCGCNGDAVDEIAREVRARIRERGDTAQMIRAEQTLQRLEGMEGKLDTLLHALSLWDEVVSEEVDDVKPLLSGTTSTGTSSGTCTTSHPHLMTASSTHHGLSLVMAAPPVNDKMKDR